jgi:hypothetical protein
MLAIVLHNLDRVGCTGNFRLWVGGGGQSYGMVSSVFPMQQFEKEYFIKGRYLGNIENRCIDTLRNKGP